MKLAEDHFGIPQLLTPQDFITEKPDEHAIMTYLSYFYYGVESPGQKFLLEWIQEQTNDDTITNFTNSWIDGNKLGLLTDVISSGGFEELVGFQELGEDVVENCKLVMESADDLLAINMTITPAQFANPTLNPVVRMIYLLQFFFATRRARVGELHIPKEAGVGACVWLEISIPNRSTSSVEAQTDGVLVGEVPTDVTAGDGKYKIKFDAEIPDMYTLNVSVGGIRVKGSPFTIDLTPPNPSSVELTNTTLSKKVGIPVILTLSTQNTKNGTLTVTASGETCGEVPHSIEVTSSTTYKVSFIPMVSDVYIIDVRLDGQHIKGSPFSFPLINLIQPETVKIGKPIIGKVGEPVAIPIDISTAGDGKLDVKCSGEKAGQVKIICTPLQSPKEAIFTPHIEDIYNVSIFFDDTEVVGSPIQVNLHPPPPDAKMVQLVHSPSESLQSHQAIKLGFDTSKAGKGSMTASCSGKRVGNVKIEVIEATENEYNTVFTPLESDIYQVDVLWGDKAVPGSPFNINLIPKDLAVPEKCKVTSVPAASDLLLTHEPIQFKIDTTDAGKGYLDIVVEVEKEDLPDIASGNDQDQISVSMFSEVSELTNVELEDDKAKELKIISEMQGNTVNSEDKPEEPNKKQEASEVASVEKEETDTVTENDKEVQPTPELTIEPIKENSKIFLVTYVPVKGGIHTLNISWSDQHIPGSPLSLNIIDPQVVDFNNPIPVEVKTIYKRKNLKVQVKKRNGTTVLDQKHVKMYKIKGGHYILTFTLKEPGIYLMHVVAKNKLIQGSPFIINYLAPKKPANAAPAVKVSGLNKKAILGEPFLFTIETVDGLLDNLSVIRHPPIVDSRATPEFAPIHIQKNEDGTISAMYTPETTGEDTVEIKLKNEPIPGSPFKVYVMDKDIEETSEKKEIHGINLDDYRFVVGESSKLKLYCNELGIGEPQVLCKPSAYADITVTEDDSEINIYWVEVKPNKAGKCTLIMRYEGSDIFGSPFAVNFLDRGYAKKCVLLNNCDIPQNPNDTEKTLCVSTKGAGKGKLTASMKSMFSEKNVEVKVEQHSKHLYHLKFTPTEGFNYILTVRFDDIDITGSPFKILLGNPSYCKVEGEGLVKSWCSKWNRFFIDSLNAGPGDLSVSFELDEEDDQAIKFKPNIIKLEEYKYEVAYQPMTPGMYWVTVKWNEINVPGSPFKVNCKSPLKPHQLSIPNPVPITHHEKRADVLVIVDEVIEEDNKLSVFMHASDNEMLQGDVTQKDDQSYMVSIQPPHLGIYSVSVLWEGQNIEGSPFEINNIPPPSASEFSIEATESDEGIIAVKVNGPMFSFRYGELSASIRNSDTSVVDEVPVNITPLSDKECEASFKPPTSGEYKLSLFYDGQHIQGSPFNLVSTDASHCYSKGKGLHTSCINQINKFRVFTENGGPGDLRVEINRCGETSDEGETMVYPEITSINQTQYEISYIPVVADVYKIAVFWDIMQIPGSPFEVNCCNPSRYSIIKVPKECSLGKPIKIGIKESSSAPSYEKLEIFARGKDRISHQGEVLKGSDGNHLGSVQPPELGTYMVYVKCNGFQILGSPFKVQVLPPPIPDKVVVSGAGIQDGLVGQRGLFQIDTSEAGHGYISLKVQGPKDGFTVSLGKSHEEDKLIIAEYNPTHTGKYTIDIMWSGIQVPNSPFIVNISEAEPQSMEAQR